jgi:radical SAM family uncharacterized protein
MIQAPSIWERLEPILPSVQSPAQYIGGELNAVRKDWSAVDVKVAVAFADTYAIGMSHLGLQIFYGMINARPDALCERIFCPWIDLEDKMRAQGIPLFSIDSHRPAREFDIIGISLQSELAYTNVLNLLDLAGIPVRQKDRGDRDPLIITGGPNGSYCEPVADFVDLVVLGDGEDAFMKIIDVVKAMKGSPRAALLKALAKEVVGAYVPSLYDVGYKPDGTIASITPKEGAPWPVKKTAVPSLPDAFFPTKPVVPHVQAVHDRINLEIMRGCPHRCRFCHAVNFKNKLRFRPVDQLVAFAEEVYRATGYDEIALTSLSSGDYPQIQELMTRLNARFKARNVSVSLPSLRVDEKLAELPPLMKTVRKSGFTIAPEAGSEELRKIIRKPIKDEDLFNTARVAFREGWNHIKLYFMVGLPMETEQDIAGIVETAKRISWIGKEVSGRPADVNVTISPFIPKPHTPFQWAGQRDFAYVLEVERRLAQLVKGTRVHLKTHDARSSYVEGVFARGDRRLGKVLERARSMGRRFDEWRECFSFEQWMEVFKTEGVDPDFYARREIPTTEILPWDMLDIGLSKDYLAREYQYCREAASARAGVTPLKPAEKVETFDAKFLERDSHAWDQG